jgi:hypothetical protein
MTDGGLGAFRHSLKGAKEENHDSLNLSLSSHRGASISSHLRILRASLKNTRADTICARISMRLRSLPAKAGIHPLPPLDAGLRRHDESREEHVVQGAAIPQSVCERELVNTSL